MKISYKYNFLSIPKHRTRCPFNRKIGDIDIFVGNGFCRGCKYFVSDSWSSEFDYSKLTYFVECEYPKLSNKIRVIKELIK
jgi:hypothetical protein